MAPRELVQVRECGDCNLCCKITRIDTEEFQKLPGRWCEHCKPGQGCLIHTERPKACRDFICLWAGGEIPEEFKPNKVKALLKASGDAKRYVVMLDTGITPDKVHIGLMKWIRRRAREGTESIIMPLGKDESILIR